MKHKLQAIPHFFTISNIFLGFMSIVYVSREIYTTAAWCIVIATVFDNLDGKLARLTRSYSRFGVELDSLADVVSFGVAPAYLVYMTNFSTVGLWGLLFSFMFLLAGVFRLARFNSTLKGYSKKNFRGLPIPVAALAIATFMIMAKHFWGTVTIEPVFLVLIPGLSVLMVSNIEYETIPRLKLSRSVKSNVKPLAYMVGFLCVIFYPKQTFFPGTMAYIFKGIILHFIAAFQTKDEEEDLQVDEEEVSN